MNSHERADRNLEALRANANDICAIARGCSYHETRLRLALSIESFDTADAREWEISRAVIRFSIMTGGL